MSGRNTEETRNAKKSQKPEGGFRCAKPLVGIRLIRSCDVVTWRLKKR
jgi:hypothetical protein